MRCSQWFLAAGKKRYKIHNWTLYRFAIFKWVFYF